MGRSSPAAMQAPGEPRAWFRHSWWERNGRGLGCLHSPAVSRAIFNVAREIVTGSSGKISGAARRIWDRASHHRKGCRSADESAGQAIGQWLADTMSTKAAGIPAAFVHRAAAAIRGPRNAGNRFRVTVSGRPASPRNSVLVAHPEKDSLGASNQCPGRAR